MLTDQELIDKILIFRGKHKMRQDMLAKNAGVSMPTLNRIELGKQKPTVMTKMKIITYMEEYENGLETNNKEN